MLHVFKTLNVHIKFIYILKWIQCTAPKLHGFQRIPSSILGNGNIRLKKKRIWESLQLFGARVSILLCFPTFWVFFLDIYFWRVFFLNLFFNLILFNPSRGFLPPFFRSPVHSTCFFWQRFTILYILPTPQKKQHVSRRLPKPMIASISLWDRNENLRFTAFEVDKTADFQKKGYPPPRPPEV